MCGITGFVHFDRDRNASLERIGEMNNIINYRGPDGDGFYVSDNLALGHRRLSIIDLSTGHQPMEEHNRYVIVFNGEIYNYLELRQELIQMGYQFKTQSDTEVILKSYVHWGYECQNKFNGMWAFAIWDKDQKELFVSRDRMGEKPLHYTMYDNSFIFGSELKSLFQYGVPQKKRLELIEIYLTLTNIPAPHTFYKGIFKLLPGHFLIVKDGVVKENKYWGFPNIDEKNMLKNKEEIYEQFQYLLNNSIKLRMHCDVPFGAFLSGGLDSSSIVALMSQYSSFPINTFTIGFDDRAFDESKLAQDVATLYHTAHFRETVVRDDFEDIIDRIAFHFDEPFGDSSAIPTGAVSRFAAEKVKMVLTGDGGDEILSGYKSYQGVKLSSIINRYPISIVRVASGINKTMSRISRGKIRYKLNKISDILDSAELDFVPRTANKIAYTELASIKLLTQQISGKIDIEDYLTEVMNDCSVKDPFYKTMYLHFMHHLPNDYLVKVDRMSMAASLETRIPFLDHRLIEYMVHVDKSVKMQGWERKSILRNTIGKHLPDSIMNAPKKGFGVPLREWFKDQSFNTQIEKNLSKVSEILDKKIVQEIIRQNNTGTKDNGNFIWTMMMLNKAL